MSLEEVSHEGPRLLGLEQVVRLHLGVLPLSQLDSVLRELGAEGHSLGL
jgi:hypothetical protein